MGMVLSVYFFLLQNEHALCAKVVQSLIKFAHTTTLPEVRARCFHSFC